jgi:hypothetical protein
VSGLILKRASASRGPESGIPARVGAVRLHHDQLELWLQSCFTLVLWVSILFLEVASFFALERIACSRMFVHLVLAFHLRGFPIELCIGIT